METTTAPLTSLFRSEEYLARQAGLTVTVLAEDTFTITFSDPEAALTAVAAAKESHVREYLRAGGNPRNRRAFGAQYGAVAKAIRKVG